MILSGVTALFLAALPSPASEVPPLFVDLSFEAAMERADAEGRVLLLDAMTSWCAPCKQMDATTWIDPRLEAWAETQAVAIQLDMDEHEALKKQLEISAFPTIIMFRGGKEFDRVVGSRTADEMLEWIGAASEGKRASDVALERLRALRSVENPEESWNGRSALVADLMWFQMNDEALVEFEWLWRNLSQQASERQLNAHWSRHKYAMRDLASRHPASVPVFARLKSEISAQVADDTANSRVLRDWIELNYVLGEEQATATWADRMVQNEAGLAKVRSLRWRLFDLLIEQNHWRTAGQSLGDVVTEVRDMRAGIGAYDSIPAEGTKKDAPKSIPAIPMMGSPRPASAPVEEPAETKEPKANAEDADATEDKPKSMPMIPMSGMRPATKKNPTEGAESAQEAMPAIPMGGAPAPASKNVAAEVRWRLSEQFRRQASERYGALLAAGRSEEAKSVADILLEELNGPRTRAQLVRTALRAGMIEAAKSRHLEWLEQITLDTSL